MGDIEPQEDTMLIITSSIEVEPSTVVHVGKYTDPSTAGDTGFFRYRDSSGRLITLGGVPQDQLDLLAASMPRPVHLGDTGHRDDWISKDHVGGIGNDERGEAVVQDADGVTLLNLGIPVEDAKKLFEL